MCLFFALPHLETHTRSEIPIQQVLGTSNVLWAAMVSNVLDAELESIVSRNRITGIVFAT